MVIIKNLESGEIINFVMHIVGTYDYLMKAKHFEDNSYLYRAPALAVVFTSMNRKVVWSTAGNTKMERL